jgi:hypothetical protein
MTLKLYHEPPFIVKGQLIDKEPPQAFRQAGVNLLGSSGIQGVDKKKRVRPSKSSQRR